MQLKKRSCCKIQTNYLKYQVLSRIKVRFAPYLWFKRFLGTPDISKNLRDNFFDQNKVSSNYLGSSNENKNIASPPKVSRKVFIEGESQESQEKENTLSNSSPKPKERNRLKEIEEELDSKKKSPQKNDEFIKVEYVTNMPDENQIMNQTNKQSIYISL